MRHHSLLRVTLVLLLAVVLCTGCTAKVEAERPASWAQQVEFPGLPNFFQVAPGLYRSAQPTAEGLRSAHELGIRTVFDLRGSSQDPELAQGLPLRLVHMPLITWNISQDEIVAVLRLIQDMPGPVLVHCRHGADRTGLIVAMYRVVMQGWSKEDAKAEMLGGGYGFHTIWQNIPVTLDEADIDAIKAELRRPLHLPGKLGENDG